MKIEICDICKKVPELEMKVCGVIRFEANEDIFGRPRDVMNICRECYYKIFNNINK